MYLLSAWNLRALSIGEVWLGFSFDIYTSVSMPFGVISILSRPRNVFSSALPKSFLDWYSAYSLSLSPKNFSQTSPGAITIDISVSPKVSLQACIVLKKSKNSTSRLYASPSILFFAASPSPLSIEDVLSASAKITVCCLSADATI